MVAGVQIGADDKIARLTAPLYHSFHKECCIISAANWPAINDVKGARYFARCLRDNVSSRWGGLFPYRTTLDTQCR